MKQEDWQWHYVKQNETSRYPRRIVCLDSESSREVTKDGERHSFMLAVASFDKIDKATGEPASTEWIETDEPEGLWEWITSKTRRRERTVVFAHNLGFDVRITKCLPILISLGWKLRFVSLDSRRCSLRLSRAEATLNLCDSFSFLPKSLEAIGAELGMPKTPLPEPGEASDKWFNRCRQDTEILRRAMLDLLQWLERNDSGNFKPTGPAQAWATYRHRFLRPRSVLVHRDEEALAAERESAWTGRTEAWRWGEFHYPLEEYDYRLAYATIATETNVPTRLLGKSSVERTHSSIEGRSGTVRLHEVVLDTDVATVPARREGFITWPIGRFRTVLWDNELRLALDNGARVHCIQEWNYRTSPALKEWGEWIIAQLTDDTLNVSPLARIMLKHWARCLIGRFSMRYPDWHYVGEAQKDELVHFQSWDLDSDTASEYLQITNSLYSCEGRRDGHDTLPAVCSYIMAVQRCKMWEAIQAAGESEVFYIDTDSILCTPTGGERLRNLKRERGHGNLLRKSQYARGIIYGPRALVLDDEPRIAGLPRKAIRTGTNSYKHTIWQSLADSLKNGDPNSVRITPRSFIVPTRDVRRRHVEHGATEPYRVEIPA